MLDWEGSETARHLCRAHLAERDGVGFVPPMQPSSLIAVLDANVLYPFTLRDDLSLASSSPIVVED